jgi:amidohydrolase
MHQSIIDLRHQLHRQPSLSGAEADTAARIRQFLTPLAPDELIEGLGGHGLACVFAGAASGPTVLLRCELDALPIQESGDCPHRSSIAGVAHQCGHDGHMAILAAVALALSRQRPACGRVVLLFQPAEETGEGAAAVLADPRFAALQPDYAFALHNVPGFPLGQVLLREGPFSCASRGMVIELSGTTAHAAQPETGVSPAAAMCRIIAGLSDLPADVRRHDEITFATVVGARLGEKAFGTAPGQAAVWATLRSETNAGMQGLIDHAESLVGATSAASGLQAAIRYEDVFPATVNAAAAVAIVRRAVADLPLAELARPFRWSEDFGHFTAAFPGALFGIGSGEQSADLHNPDYDFPDPLIAIAQGLFLRVIEQCAVEA